MSRPGPLKLAQQAIGEAEKCLASYRFSTAATLLGMAEAEMQRLPYHHRPYERHKAVADRLSVERKKPCVTASRDCLFCSLTEEQKQTATELADKKTAIFDLAYPNNQENNFTGAYAEAVFSVSFRLPINLEPSPDGGIDFRFPNGLTVDVKGTTYNDCPPLTTKSLIRRPDHVFVYIGVVDRLHAFFRGFAFGSDEFVYQTSWYWEGESGFRPKRTPRRTLQEFKDVVSATLSGGQTNTSELFL